MAKEGTETVLIKRPAVASGQTDEDFYGESSSAPTGDGLGVVATLQRCIIWPRSSSSTSERGITTIAGLHIFTPPDGVEWAETVAEADRELRPEDHVLARGVDWQMDGAVGDWRKKAGDRVGYLFEVGRWSS